jgi:hypothetical protein
MSTENTTVEQTAAQPVELEPSDYATGFIEGYLRAQGVSLPPDVNQFRAALTELSQHLGEIRQHAH